jgi:hypothetical protein
MIMTTIYSLPLFHVLLVLGKNTLSQSATLVAPKCTMIILQKNILLTVPSITGAFVVKATACTVPPLLHHLLFEGETELYDICGGALLVDHLLHMKEVEHCITIGLAHLHYATLHLAIGYTDLPLCILVIFDQRDQL